MQIPKALIDEMVAHARDEVPNECCGMLGGTGDEASSAHRVESLDPSPFRFEMTGKPLFSALRAIEDSGEELVAIYHSHTKSAAQPSQTDVNMARLWPDPVWIIVSLEDPGNPDVRGYRIHDGEVSVAELDVV